MLCVGMTRHWGWGPRRNRFSRLAYPDASEVSAATCVVGAITLLALRPSGARGGMPAKAGIQAAVSSKVRSSHDWTLIIGQTVLYEHGLEIMLITDSSGESCFQ